MMKHTKEEKATKIQTQLCFKKHSGNTTSFQEQQKQQSLSKSLTDCYKCLRTVFGLKEFRGQQEAIVRASLEGKDLLVIMPTGGGKSLCYQLPAVMSKGVTLVVSPLLALIHDQATALLRLGIKAAALNSSIGKIERAKVLRDLGLSEPLTKLLYVTPELLATTEFRKYIAALHGRDMLARLVIDEAHCISEWGHDFRKDYKKLDYFRKAFPNLPIAALTATATEKVRQDIKVTLGLPEPPQLSFFMSSFNRDNLYYEVRFDENRYENFHSFMRGVYKTRMKRLQASAESKGTLPPAKFTSARTYTPTEPPKPLPDQKVEPVCGIIYCGQRATCDDLANRLVGDGVSAAAFHSGMTLKQRADVQRRWCLEAPAVDPNNKDGSSTTSAAGKPVDVIVATIAFGMGIDKANVRFVCHWEIPKTVEGFYQESGRAGRDGNLSRCILYYSREDKSKIEFLLAMEAERQKQKGKKAGDPPPRKKSLQDTMDKFQKMVAYCENTTQCRHVFLCEYFGEVDVKKETVCQDSARCDICRTPDKVAKDKAEKLTSLTSTGGRAQYMGGTKTFVGSDGTVQVQGAWQSASSALDRYDAGLAGYDDDYGDGGDDDSEGGEGSDDDEIEDGSDNEEDDRRNRDDYDSDAERKAKRRKLLFGKSVDPSYYKKSDTPALPSAVVLETITANKYGLAQATSSKVALKFRELCYETVERALASLYQSSHKSLSTDYLLRLTPNTTANLAKTELDARMGKFVKVLAVQIETTAFEASGTQNIYKTLLGHRVKDIKGFETKAMSALSLLTLQQQQSGGDNIGAQLSISTDGTVTKDSNLAWTAAIELWQHQQQDVAAKEGAKEDA
ncbi:MAG: P-loop containing nucleoside triphosphate hydrolase protein [Linnemannia gamsii]|nr:MAG: P-loop containing nucleoside triphosphate hydrolase protein [Linnemannia gamsii]